ncbi:MAG: MaoC family dehydratase [Gammaproteobacteria bacterium]|jgi:acyl dehydratase|nr:MaoC family dehydratase [Gammaproteobacteria bacterium]
MSAINFESLSVGDELPSLAKPLISRTTLALFAGASGDHNPIHIDIDFARAAGMDDVFAHGMLGMAYLGQLLTQWVPQQQLRSYGVRFGSITQLGAQMSCAGKVVEKFEENGEKRVRLELQATDENGDVKLVGQAVAALD